MAACSLSSQAATDIAGIYEYTIQTFGLAQARNYLAGLHDRFQMLAENPLYGRSATDLATNLRRLEYRSHVVFYVPKEPSILIVRVLHQSMDATTHF
jgi:toxin ParE1/3/4